MIVVRDAEAGNIICEVESQKEGEDLIAEYEARDIKEGIYEPGFYEVAEIENL